MKTNKTGFGPLFSFLRQCEGGYICRNDACSFLYLSNGEPNTTRFEKRLKDCFCTECSQKSHQVLCNALKAAVFTHPTDAITQIKYVVICAVELIIIFVLEYFMKSNIIAKHV